MKSLRILMAMVITLLFAGSGFSGDIPQDMQLLGKGQAYYLKFIKVYDAALYGNIPAGEKDILSKEVSKCLHLEYAVGVGPDDFAAAAETVLQRQFTEEQLAGVSDEIERLHAAYRDVEAGDSYTLCYDGSTFETTLSHNGEPSVVIRSAEFAAVYFSIWLGEREPLDVKLRDKLLAAYQRDDTKPGA